MPQFQQILSALREQLSANVSRSDVLKPLAWLIGLLLAGTLLSSLEKAPIWLTATLLGMIGAAGIVYGGAYIFCLVIDRDALRSERYSLSKLALEHGVYGDSEVGIIEDQTRDRSTLLPPPSDGETGPNKGEE